MQARTSSDTGVPQKPRTLRVAPHNFVEIVYPENYPYNPITWVFDLL